MLSELINILSILGLVCVAGCYILYREHNRTSFWLASALLLTALLEFFDLMSVTAGDPLFWKRFSLIAESLLPFFWLMCSLTYSRENGFKNTGPLMKGTLVAALLLSLLPLVLPLEIFFYTPDFPQERLLFLGNVGYMFYLGIMIALVLALVNFENTLISASPESLRQMKFQITGLGVILGALVFYFSQSVLYRSLNMNYFGLRSFLYLLAIALIVYSLLFRKENTRVQVSRQVAFKSFVFMAFGAYLVIVGLMGEGMQYFGVPYQKVVTVSFAFIAAVMLLLLFLSDRFRREIKVALHKNFYQNKYDYRIQWLHFTQQLATSRSGHELIQRILESYCEIFGVSGSALFLQDSACGGYAVTAAHQMEDMHETISPDNKLITFMEKRDWVINLHDNNPEIMAENEVFFSNNGISFIVPLFISERLEGFIVIGSSLKDNEVYIYEDYDLMKTISRQASQAIFHQRLLEELAQAREMEAVGKVSTFVAHDLKNLVSNLSLIVENAGRHIQNPDFQQDMLESLGNTVARMKRMIAKLKNLGDREHYVLKPVNLLDLAQKTASLAKGASVIVEGTPEKAMVDEDEMQNVILNLVINAIEASGPDQVITIRTGANNDGVYISVQDQGCGMSADFVRNELFKPFRTTKNKGIGIGLYQCRQTAETFGGRIKVESSIGAGSTFTVYFNPLVPGSENVSPPTGNDYL